MRATAAAGGSKYCLTTSTVLYSSVGSIVTGAVLKLLLHAYICCCWMEGEGRERLRNCCSQHEYQRAHWDDEGGLEQDRAMQSRTHYLPNPTGLSDEDRKKTASKQASECTYRTLAFGTSDSLFTFAQLQVMVVTSNGLQPLTCGARGSHGSECVVSKHAHVRLPSRPPRQGLIGA
jgi:hypothetical protein